MRDDGQRDPVNPAGAGFRPTVPVRPQAGELGFAYGDDAFGPPAEVRRLDDIRSSLLDPRASGPEEVYAIAMDVGRREDRRALVASGLLFGVVAFAAGRLGDEPVRSQGHVHAITPATGWSPPEVFQIWEGRAVILMQESADADPGRVFAIHAGPGDVVVTPPGWAHATVNASQTRRLVFGAWCDRRYAGFEYAEIRRRKGLAWYPVIAGDGEIAWKANPRYDRHRLEARASSGGGALGVRSGECIYAQAVREPDAFRFVPDPAAAGEVWVGFEP